MKPSNSPCPTFEELSRSMGGLRSRRIAAHLARCETCRRTCAALAELEEVARSLPAPTPAPHAARRMEETLVAIAPAPRSARGGRPLPRRIAAGAAIAAGIAAVVALFPAEERAPLRHLEASEGARFERLTQHPAGDGEAAVELVRLEQGTVALQVEHLSPKERFVVTTADAEVEVRGTRFEVDAEDGLLRRVAVSEGRVEVRVRGEPPVLLLPGQRWLRLDPPAPSGVDQMASADALEEPPVPAASPAAGIGAMAASIPDEPRAIASGQVRRRSPTPPAPSPLEPPGAPAPSPLEPPASDPDDASAAPPVFPAEEAFASGWAALRDGDAGEAARRFAAAAEGRHDALGQDAAYWEIVALGRSGAAADAERRMARFLERHRSSPRAGEVALMLGLRLAARGDRAGALAHLRAARTDADPRVRETAGQALDRLGDPDPDRLP
ncbi:MAG TPA: FecR family protein [Vulgatibacter sp.]|nr:FecR family protein [Vulgatibacter sp.]